MQSTVPIPYVLGRIVDTCACEVAGGGDNPYNLPLGTVYNIAYYVGSGPQADKGGCDSVISDGAKKTIKSHSRKNSKRG